jgi:putative transcriptional regulator
VENLVIRFRLKERIADLEFQRGTKVTLDEISAATGIHRTTLSKIAGRRGYNTTTDNLAALCAFFECELGEIAEFVGEEK